MNKVIIITGKQGSGKSTKLREIVGQYNYIDIGDSLISGEWKKEVASTNCKFITIDGLTNQHIEHENFKQLITCESFTARPYYGLINNRYDRPILILTCQEKISKQDFRQREHIEFIEL